MNQELVGVGGGVQAVPGSHELWSRSPWPQTDTSVWVSFYLGVPLWPEDFILLIGAGRFCRADIWFLCGLLGSMSA